MIVEPGEIYISMEEFQIPQKLIILVKTIMKTHSIRSKRDNTYIRVQPSIQYILFDVG